METTLKAGLTNVDLLHYCLLCELLHIRCFSPFLFVCLTDSRRPSTGVAKLANCADCVDYFGRFRRFLTRGIVPVLAVSPFGRRPRGRCGGVLWSRVMIMIVRLSMCFARFYNFTCSHSVCQCVLHDFTFYNFTLWTWDCPVLEHFTRQHSSIRIETNEINDVKAMSRWALALHYVPIPTIWRIYRFPGKA